MVKIAFQTKHHIATTNEITITIEIIISTEFENAFKTKQSIEKTTTTEITFIIEIVMSLVLYFKWIAHILIILR